MKIKVWVQQEVEIPNECLKDLIKANEDNFQVGRFDTHYLQDIVNRAINAGLVEISDEFRSVDENGYTAKELIALSKRKTK